jgi:hypothetical protein
MGPEGLLSDMNARRGKVDRGVRRAFLVSNGRVLTTRELWTWTHPRELHHRDRHRRKDISRSIRRAAEKLAIRVGRRWPDGLVWRLRAEVIPLSTLENTVKTGLAANLPIWGAIVEAGETS